MAENPYVNKVVLGDQTLIDITDTTATAPDVLEGEYFYLASGQRVQGTGSRGMVILSYGSSTWQDFITAYNSNLVVYCRASSNSNPASGSQTRMAFMAYVNNAETPTNVEFQYYRSVATHSDSQQGDQVYVYKLDKTNGWSVITRNAFTKIVAGTGLSSSYSSGVLTMTSVDELPAVSSSDNGKVLGVENGAWSKITPSSSNGLPTGGSAGQVLMKDSSTDYDTDWENLPDTIHVGTSEPSDPAIKIWYDTDEPGQTVVTSVNGASGAVVFDADDMNAMHWDLLWENASPTSSFSAQTVSLDLSDYTFVIIGFRWSESGDQINWQVCMVGETNKITRVDISSTTPWIARRSAQVSATGVTFTAADQGSTSTSPYTANGELIPALIYGIRGIIAT